MSLPVTTLPIKEQENSTNKSTDGKMSSAHELGKYDLLSEFVREEQEEQEELEEEEEYDVSNGKELRSSNTIMQASLSNSILEANSSYAYLWQSNEERNAHDLYVLEEMEKLVKQLCHRLCAVLKESCYIHCASEMSHELLCEDNIAMLSSAGLLHYFQNVNYAEYLQYIQRVSHTDGTQLARTFVMCMTDRLVTYFLELYINPLIHHLREMVVVSDVKANQYVSKLEGEKFVDEEHHPLHHYSKKSENNRKADNHKFSMKSREPVSSIVFDEHNDLHTTDNTNIIKGHSKHNCLEVKADETQGKMLSEPHCVIELYTNEVATHHISVNDAGEVDGLESSEMLYSSCEGNIAHSNQSNNNSSHTIHIAAANNSTSSIKDKKPKQDSKTHNVKLQSVEPFASTQTTNTTVISNKHSDNVSNTSNNDELIKLDVWNEIKDNIARMLNMEKKSNVNELKESKHCKKQHNNNNNNMDIDAIAQTKQSMYNSIVYSLESVLHNREWHDMYNSVLRYTFAQLYLHVVKRFGLILRLKLMEHYERDGNEYSYMNSDNLPNVLFKKTFKLINDEDNVRGEKSNSDESHRIAECINVLNDVLRDCIDEHYHNSATQLKTYLKQQRVRLIESIHKYHEYQVVHHQHINCNSSNGEGHSKCHESMMIIDEVFAKEKLIYNIWNKSSSDNYQSSTIDSYCNYNRNNNINNLSHEQNTNSNKFESRKEGNDDDNYNNSEEKDENNEENVNSESDSRYIRSSSGSRGRLNYKLSSVSSILKNDNNTIVRNRSDSATVSPSVIVTDKLEPSSISGGDHYASAPLLLNYWLQNLNHIVTHEEDHKDETNSCKQSKQTTAAASSCSPSSSSSSNSVINGAKALDLILGEYNNCSNNVQNEQVLNKNGISNKDEMNSKLQNEANHCVLEDTAEDAKLYDLLTSSALVQIRSLQKLIHANANHLFVALMTDRLAVFFRERDICDKLHLPELKISEILQNNISIINACEKEKLKGGKREIDANCKKSEKAKTKVGSEKSSKEVLEENTEQTVSCNADINKNSNSKNSSSNGARHLNSDKLKADNMENHSKEDARVSKESKGNFQGHLSMASTSSLMSARSSNTRTRNSSMASSIVLRHMLENEKQEITCQCVLM